MGMTEITVRCCMCRTDHKVKVDATSYDMWRRGFGPIQEVLRELTPGERELFISHTCEECWNKMFGGTK